MNRARTANGVGALLFEAARAIPRNWPSTWLGGSDTQRERAPRNRRGSSLVGIDLAPEFRLRRSRSFVIALAGGIVAALLIAGLRIDLLRKSYASAAAVKEEQALEEEKQNLLVEMRRLRDPEDLVAQARQLGFGHPDRVIDLDESRRPASLPAVGTRP